MAVDKVTGPLGPRRAIARTVRELREAWHQPLKEFARRLMMSISKRFPFKTAEGEPWPRDMTCIYALFEYKDMGESEIVHIETHAGFSSVEDKAQVKKYRTYHDALIRASLTGEDSMDLIRSIHDTPVGQL